LMRPQEGAHPDPVDDAPNVYTDHEFPVAGRHVDYSVAVHRHAGVVAGDVELAEITPPDATGQITGYSGVCPRDLDISNTAVDTAVVERFRRSIVPRSNLGRPSSFQYGMKLSSR
jgi:hypothetical protein